jgi:hypothetical protein
MLFQLQTVLQRHCGACGASILSVASGWMLFASIKKIGMNVASRYRSWRGSRSAQGIVLWLGEGCRPVPTSSFVVTWCPIETHVLSESDQAGALACSEVAVEATHTHWWQRVWIYQKYMVAAKTPYFISPTHTLSWAHPRDSQDGSSHL